MLVALAVLVVVVIRAMLVLVEPLVPQILVVVVLVAVLVLQQQVRVVLALLLFLHPKRRHLPQVLQPLQQAVAEQFINLTLLVQLHSEVKHESLRKSC